MRTRRVAIVLLLTSACDRAPEPADSAPAAPPPPAPPAKEEPKPAPPPVTLTPSALPICRSPAHDDPLAIICKLGAPALEARFECETPEPLMFCGAFDEWTCRYMAFAGEEPPPLTYRARFDHVGPPVKSGDIIEDGAFQRTGTIRGVSAQLQEKDEAAGLAKAAEWTAKLREWGCTVKDEYGATKVLTCGTWEAKTTYNEIIEDVIVEAALTGFLECKG